MTGINDGEFTINKGQGISQAIAEEIGLTKEQCKKVDWKSVFEIVNEAKGKEGNNVNWGGGNNLYGSGSSNYVVHKGDVFEFSNEFWTRIVDTVKNSLTAKGISTDNLNEEVPPPPEPYAEASRFESRKIDETKTERFKIRDAQAAKFYDTEGKLVKLVTLKADNTTFERHYDAEERVTHTIERDEQGAITHAEAFDKEDKKLSWQDEKGNVYPENGSKIGFKFGDGYIVNNYGFGNDAFLSTYNYDDDGKILSETGFGKYIYNYDNNGKLANKLCYHYYDDSYIGREEYKDGNLVRYIDYDGDIREYKYDENNKLIRLLWADSSDYIEYEYTDNGYIDKCYNDGRLVMACEFDNYGHPKKITSYSNGKLDYEEVLERDADGVWDWVYHTSDE